MNEADIKAYDNGMVLTRIVKGQLRQMSSRILTHVVKGYD